ncbi:quinone-dependent dihydroorotate dehydrogenase [Litoribacillus peritrichatus]|uniref:Dihydroorotate dehydrogenase (quinone) n=1 Tax=Litoribacillus peritrichatus TaxID=718191 RepID=A0ABP7MHM8_9GAMM
MLYPILRSMLFKLSPETAHELTLEGLQALSRIGVAGLLNQNVAYSPVDVMGIEFPNPVGLAAGLDKNGECIDGLAALGFGFIEIGTVTPRPQPGNPKPRMFRLPEAEGIINRMGFNNKGVDFLVEQVKKAKFKGVLGINIGKNFDTAVEDANEDYVTCLRKVYDYATYVTVNISSPNTPGLRNLQMGDSLESLIKAVKEEQTKLAAEKNRYVPIAVKIAPDMDDEAIEWVAKTLVKHKIDGVIATNTTIAREKVEGLEFGDEQGGLSGAPVFESSTQVTEKLAKALDGKLPIIGVGGINSKETAAAKIEAGASLVQIYSGFVYEGPALIKQAFEGVNEARRAIVKAQGE